MAKLINVSSWGRLTKSKHDVRFLLNTDNVATQLKNQSPGIAYGFGRSYGDVCLNPGGILWNTKGLDRFISFDKITGRLVCEAGVLLRDIQRLLVPRGWMLPVTPGTQLVTVGGAIANDVHGKNHFAFGSFGNHLKHIKLIRSSGEIIECGPDEKSDWFSATIGGLGLTGIILQAEIQLRPIKSAFLTTETIAYENLDEFFLLSDASEKNWEHIVSWVDCLSKIGRGVLMRGNFVESHLPSPKNREITIPFTPPISLVNRFSLRPLNMAYFYLKKRHAEPKIMHYESFLYPLDHLLEWNRLYGPRGFFQYQVVLSRDVGKDAIAALLHEIVRSGEGSFLTTLKTFSDYQPLGMMSFPKSGVTLALDFPNKGKKTLKLFDRFNAIVKEANGRLYLAKDACMPRDLFLQSYPQLQKFLSYRDPAMSSSLSRRLIGS